MSFHDDDDNDDFTSESDAALFNKQMELKYSELTTLDLIKHMHAYGVQQKERKAELKLINKEYDFLRLNAVPKAFERDGIERLSVAGIGRVSLTGDMYVTAIKAKTFEFFQWLRDRGSGSLIKEAVQASTLKAAAKKWLADGDEIPEDLIKVTPFTRASITKTK